jgi:hypothetical protein
VVSSGGEDGEQAAASRALAWPLQRRDTRGWRLRVAWAFNGTLVGGGLVWLAIMLRAIDIEHGGIDNVDLGGFWRTFILGLVQAYLIQDPIKVLLVSFVSPAFWSGLLKPGTKRAEGLRMCLRGVFNALIAIV